MTDPAPDHANIRIPPPVLWLVLVAVGYGLDRWLLPLPFVTEGYPGVFVGIIIWLLGFGLAVIAIVQFRRAGTDVRTETPTDAIVGTGVFAWSRNPIYIGAHIGIVGVAIALDSLWVLAMLVPFYLVIRYAVVAREEAYLERKFGQTYLDYKARVRRWI